MNRKWSKIGISIISVSLLIIVAITNVVGCQMVQSSNKTTTNDITSGFKQDELINCNFNPMMQYNGWHNHPVNITFPNGSWVQIFVNIDGGDWFEYTEPIVITTEGWHVVLWYWIDEWGNQFDGIPFEFGIDMTPPIVNVNVEGNWFEGWRAIVEIVDPLSGINFLELYFNGLLMVSEFIGGFPTYTFIFNLTPLPNNIIKVYVSDTAGNEVNCSSNVTSIHNKNQQGYQQINPILYFLNYIQIRFNLFEFS